MEPIRCVPSGISTRVKPSQLKKVLSPMVVRFLGRVISGSFLHWRNTVCPSSVISSESRTRSRFVQP